MSPQTHMPQHFVPWSQCYLAGGDSLERVSSQSPALSFYSQVAVPLFSLFPLTLKVCDSVLLRDQIQQGMNTQIQRTLNEMIQTLFEVGSLISIMREELLL